MRLGVPIRLRVLLPVTAAVVAVVVAILVGWILVPHGPAGAAEIGGPFSLIDGQGHTVTDRDLRGRFALIYFGYTFCPDVCPTTLGTVTAAMDSLGAQAERVQPVFITIDPRRDTPEVMRSYTAAFSSHLLGLTGSAEAVAAAARAYRVYYAPHRTGEGPNDYSMDHSSILYLMGPDGDFRAVIPADAPAAEMAADLRHYL